MAKMLYKGNGKTLLHGVMVDYVVVEPKKIEAMMNDGWHETPQKAADAVSMTAMVPEVKPDKKSEEKPQEKTDKKSEENLNKKNVDK